MKAVILAGGKASRLKEKTKNTPKSLIKIGDKAIIEHQLLLLKRYGISEIYILVNRLKEQIIDYINKHNNFNLNIKFIEENPPLGTAGGITLIKEQLNCNFFLLYGDIMINMDLTKFYKFHKNKKSDISIVLHPNNHPYDSDLVDINDDNKIIAFYPKPHKKNQYYRNLVNAGLYILTPEIFNFLNKKEKKDFGREVFPKIYDKVKMFGYKSTEYLKDMGTPERLKEVNSDFLNGKITLRNYRNKQKAIFLDRDGVINVDTAFIKTPEELKIYPFSAKAIKKINKSLYLSIIVTNQSIIARNLCTISELRQIHNKLEWELGKQQAYIDDIFFCPHHPDKGYPEENKKYKVTCKCRKPLPGMLLEASKKYNIDLKESFIIGDSERDILTGINAGVTTIGVRTGNALKNSKILPDYIFSNIKEAVDFIIDEPYKDLFHKLLKIKENKNLILIAGNTRAGKTTLATYLKKQFEKINIKSKIINLDYWILNKENRSETHNVFDRFRIKKINEDMIRLFNGEKIIAGSYTHHPSWKEKEKIYKLNNEEIIIIEGVVALNIKLPEKLEKNIIKIFINIDKEKLKEKFFEFYKWKGFEKEYINKLFKKRWKDEYSIIEKDIEKADIIINSPIGTTLW